MRHPSPAQLAACGEEQLQRELKPLAPRLYKRLARDIMQALSEQTVVVPGTDSASLVLPRLCAQPPACAISALTSAPRSSSGLPPTLAAPSSPDRPASDPPHPAPPGGGPAVRTAARL